MSGWQSALGAERGQLGGAAEQGVGGHTQLPCELVDALRVVGGERRDAGGAIAIDPAHVMRPLARGFHERAQEILVGGREIHGRQFPRRGRRRQFLWGARKSETTKYTKHTNEDPGKGGWAM